MAGKESYIRRETETPGNWSGKTGKAGKAESTEGKVQETH